MLDIAKFRFKSGYVGFNDLRILIDPSVNGDVIDFKAIALFQVVCNLAQGDILSS